MAPLAAAPGTAAFVDHLWPTVERALDWVLSLRRDDGTGRCGRSRPTAAPWDYALLTGIVEHPARPALRRQRSAALVGEPRPDWVAAADRAVRRRSPSSPRAFEPKDRWAMDWYYPVLTGALDRRGGQGPAGRRLGRRSRWRACGIRCVSDEPWVTASETAECALAYAAIGDLATATDLLRWTRAHRRDDGVVLDRASCTPGTRPVRFPFDEHTSYTAAAVILAADAIAGASPGAARPLRLPVLRRPY